MTAAWEEHFDELAELGEAERARRLAGLASLDPDLARFLEGLLAADAGEHGELPETLAEKAPLLAARALTEAGAAARDDRAGERIGNYRLLTLLGRGGMGEVWLAERADGEFDSRVALKLVRSELGSEAILSGFLRERRILARLGHPGIARLLDGGRSRTGEPYFVLEHVDGTPITEWCASRGPSLEERLRLMIEVCEAVDHAHRGLVVHRDLKPSNVLVDGSGRPKLLDFGIAQLLSPEPGRAGLGESAASHPGARAFTPGYASPEQIRGEPVTTATDVYALGVLLYELLTGKKPFRRAARSLPELIEEISTETLESPSERLRRTHAGERIRGPEGLPVRLPGDLDAITAKALARDPDERYPGAAALAEDLRRFLDRRPVRARPATATYRAGRFVARHRLAVLAATLAVVSLLGGLTAALWQARVAQAEAERAKRARGFLGSILEKLDPEQRGGEGVTPGSLLAHGVSRVDHELADEPGFQAEMLDLLANLHRKLGLLAEGRVLAERSLALRRLLFGESSAETAQSLTTLGWIQLDQGEPAQARVLLEQAVASLERLEGPDSLAAADAREPLVEAIFAGDSAVAALTVAERRLAAYRRILGERHEKTALALNDRGVLLEQLGRVREAEAAYRESLAVLDSRLPAGDPRRAYPHLNLGSLLVSLGLTNEAERELRKAYELRRRALGPRHPETAATLGYLAKALLDLGRLEAAEAAARQAVETLADKDRFNAANAKVVLGGILFYGSRYAEAVSWLEQGISELEMLVGSDHSLVLSARGWRGQALLGAGRRAEGVAELRSAIAGLAKLGEGGDDQRADLLNALGEEMRLQKKPAEALKLHLQFRQLTVRQYGEEHFRTGLADGQMAFDLLADPASGEVEIRRAETLLLQARDRLRRLAPELPALATIESRLAALQKRYSHHDGHPGDHGGH